VRPRLSRAEGRKLFGTTPETYDRARPGHPEAVYEILRNRCGLRPGSKVLEIGPGTGQATRRLLDVGADPLVGIEPDPALAEFLRARFGDRIELRATTLEDAELEDDFDLAVAASSFHWVDEAIGLAALLRALRPGGWVALWWTVFGDATREDPFRDVSEPLMRDLPHSPSQPESGPSFGLDAGARVAALEAAAFEDARPHRLPWTHTWDTEGIRGLFESFSPVLAMEPDRREALLDRVAGIAASEFGGRVTKPIVTALYTARKPS
jgi:SAM-dependent methyltransferase